MLVVVGDVFQILPLEHGFLQLLRGRGQRAQIRAQQRHRHRPAERRERGKAEVFCAVDGSYFFPHLGADVRRTHVAALPIEQLYVDESIVRRGTDALVDGEDHVHAIFPVRLEFFVDLPDLGFNGIQLGQRDFLPSATDHGQIHGQVVPFNEGEEGGLYEPASNQTRNGNQEQRHEGGEGNPRLVQRKAQDRRIHAVLEEIHDSAHAPLHGIGLKIASQRLAVTHVCRQDESPLHKAEQQGEHDHLGHVAEEVPQLAFDEEEGCERDHGRDNRSKHRRQHFHRAIDGGLGSAFAHLVMPVDVLCNHNSVIHQDANHEDHPKQADDVDGHPQHAREDEHAGERHGNGKCHPKREADVQEQRQQKDHE